MSGYTYTMHAENKREWGILWEVVGIYKTLIEKNRAYGDSALNPVRVFCKFDRLEQIRVRIDDKLSRIRNDPGALNEDALLDLIGYLLLYRVGLREDREEQESEPQAGGAQEEG